MSQDANDGETRLRNYLSKKSNPEAISIPNETLKEIPKENEKPKKETPKNDEYNTYDYSDDEKADDKNW